MSECESIQCEPTGKLERVRRASVVQQLKSKRDALTEQLADVNAALKLFDENPTLCQAFDLIAQIGSIRL